MEAKHQDGTIHDANDITSADKRKPGPWYCKTSGCPVVFKGHRSASYAVDDLGRVLRSGTFVHGSSRNHSPDCFLNARSQLQRLLGAHGGVVTVSGEKLLLRWGDPVKKNAPSGTPRPRKAGVERERYAAVLAAASDVAGVVDESGDDAEVLARFWVVHQGIRYAWSEFCFGPTATGMEKLVNSIDRAFNESLTRRPRLLRAVVADVAVPTSKKDRLMVRLRSVDRLGNGKYVRARLFADAESEGGAALRALAGGATTYVLGDRWRTYLDGPSLDVVNGAQLSCP